MTSERTHLLNDAPVRQGQYILYRMQASQRIQGNLALTKAILLANETGLPLLILFHLNANYPEANYRHFKFMIDGLLECSDIATRHGIGFQLTDKPQDQLFQLYYRQAAAIICDQGYMRPQREWQDKLVKELTCRIESVEDNLIIPITSASHKAEWNARTLRPQLTKKIPYFINDANIQLTPLKHPYPVTENQNYEIAECFLENIRKNNYLSPVNQPAGEKAAQKCLQDFIHTRLANYGRDRNDPSLAASSHLSSYLHFGQISPLQIIRAMNSLPDTAPFIEQLLIRRELAHNFVFFTPEYDTYSSLPNWCRQTLKARETDPRPHNYTPEELENAKTSDLYWNVAMNEMRQTGYMENTMRMYWGKKIIEWSSTPEEAYTTILCLNNRYFLDGRDANSYAGIGWCFGLHDRPWPSHPIFGSVRTMTGKGLARKYDMNTYCHKFRSYSS